MPTKVCLVKAMVFPVVMYGCESWIIKKAGCWKTDAFERWYWRRLLRVPCKNIKPVHPNGNQSWIFIGRTDAEAEAPMLWPPDAKNWLTGKDPDAGKDWRVPGEGDNRGWDGWMALPTQWMWVWAGSGSWWWTGNPGVLQSRGSQRVGHDWVMELNWTDANYRNTESDWRTSLAVKWLRLHLPMQGVQGQSMGGAKTPNALQPKKKKSHKKEAALQWIQ